MNGAEPFAEARGWAALTEDIERRLGEARRYADAEDGNKRQNKEYVKGFYNGEIAALEWLLMRHARREKVRPNDQALPQGGAQEAHE